MGVARINMTRVVKMFALPSGSVALLRADAPGQYVNGRYEEPSRTRIPLTTCSVQDIDGEERQSLPEAARTKNAQRFFSIDEAKPLSRTDQLPADLLEFDGAQWEQVSTANWNANANYWDVVAVRLGQ